ncbi:MAG: glycosyltransferase family 2 protein [Burkholderiales bacterium]
MISVLILTRNEEHDLPGCLHSVAWSDDVHVFDSLSDDGTAAVAQSHGARVTTRAFDNYASQRNAALHGLTFKYPWVLTLDADERVPDALRAEMQEKVSAAAHTVAAFRLRRRDYLGNTWLKRSQLSPWYIRLARPHLVRYERAVNEILVVDGVIQNLHEPFDHFPFSKGMSHWLAKHNTYSTMEARHIVETRHSQPRFSVVQAFFNKDFNERRFHQKELFYRLPARPLLKFLLVYFFRMGMLDGRAGLTYATLQSIYETMIVLKTQELQDANDRFSRPTAQSRTLES